MKTTTIFTDKKWAVIEDPKFTKSFYGDKILDINAGRNKMERFAIMCVNIMLVLCAHQLKKTKVMVNGKAMMLGGVSRKNIARHTGAKYKNINCLSQVLCKLKKELGFFSVQIHKSLEQSMTWYDIDFDVADEFINKICGLHLSDFDIDAMLSNEIVYGMKEAKMKRKRGKRKPHAHKRQEELAENFEILNAMHPSLRVTNLMKVLTMRSTNELANVPRADRLEYAEEIFEREFERLYEHDINACVPRMYGMLYRHFSFDRDFVMNCRKGCSVNGEVTEPVKLFSATDDEYADIAEEAGYELTSEVRGAFKRVVLPCCMSANRFIYSARRYEKGLIYDADFERLEKAFHEKITKILKKIANALHRLYGWAVKFGSDIFIMESLIMAYVNVMVQVGGTDSFPVYDALFAERELDRNYLDELVNEAFATFVRDLDRSWLRTCIKREETFVPYAV